MGRSLRPFVPLAVAFLHGALDVALHVTLGHVGALVEELLAACEPNNELDAVVLVEEELERHEGQPFEAQLCVEVVDLPATDENSQCMGFFLE